MIPSDNGFGIGMLQPFGLQIIEDRHMVDNRRGLVRCSVTVAGRSTPQARLPAAD